MRNVTISLPDPIYRKARVAAAQDDASLSAWVSELVVGTFEDQAEFNRLKKLQDELFASIDTFDPADRLSRDELHHR